MATRISQPFEDEVDFHLGLVTISGVIFPHRWQFGIFLFHKEHPYGALACSSLRTDITVRIRPSEMTFIIALHANLHPPFSFLRLHFDPKPLKLFCCL